jgi:hypothetical protein
MIVRNSAWSAARMLGSAIRSAEPWIEARRAPTVVTESATHS